MRPQLERIWMIRFSDGIHWPDGSWTHLCAKRGEYEEVKAFAEKTAEENGVEVEIII